MTTKPLFPNPFIGNYVTSDIDVYFEYFIRPLADCPDDERPGLNLEYVREQVVKIEAKIEQSLYVEYRRSSSGNTHVRVTFPEQITVSDAFYIRANLFDDLTRLSLDMRRFSLWGSLHEIHKCFDEKATTKGGVKKAGPWIPLNKGRDELTGPAREDWEQYWESIGRQYHKGENHRALIRSHFKNLTENQKQDTIRDLIRSMVEDSEQATMDFGGA